MATNHEDQLGEIYPTMLNELNCTFRVSFTTFSLLWLSWSWIVAVMVMDCGRHGHWLWPSWSWIVAVMVMDCGRHGHGLWPSWYRPG